MRILKKPLSIIITLALFVSCFSGSLALAAQEDDKLPIVYVTGFGSANIYYEDDPEQKSLFFPVDTDRILGNLKNIGDSIIESIKKGDPDLLYTILYNFFDQSFGMLALGTDGVTMMEGVAVDPVTLTYKDGRYEFLYDSRRSPLELAVELRDYIELVKDVTGSDKIELVCSSYGTTVLLSYLDIYKTELDDLDSVVMCVPVVGGISFIGELFCGKLNLDPYAIEDFVSTRLDMTGLGIILKAMNETGLLQLMIDAMVLPFMEEAILDAFLDFGYNKIATLPAIWTCIQDEYFETALSNSFGENYLDDDNEYAVLIDKVIEYHERIMLRSEEILDYTTETYDELHLAIICKYGVSALPMSDDTCYADDGFSPLSLASFGATSGKYGKQLDKDYTQALYPEYSFMSADGCVDASTGKYPFTTWYLKGLEHTQKNDDYWLVINAVCHNNLDVFTDESFPQFMQVSAEDENHLVPLEPVEYKEPTTAFEDLLTFIKEIFLDIFKKLFFIGE